MQRQSCPVKDLVTCRIGSDIPKVSLIVIIRFFSYRNSQYESQWCYVGGEETYPQGRYKLTECDEKEVEVEEELELLVEDYREEGSDIVFLISDDIGGEPRLELV